MAIHNTPEERQLIKLLQKLAIPEAERKTWVDQIQAGGMTEDLANQIHQHLATPVEGEDPLPNRAVAVVEFSQLIRRWRMAQGAKKFH